MQIATSLAVTRELASTASPPAFVPGTPLATFDDAIAASRIVNRAYADRGRFSAADQQTLSDLRASARRIVDEGRAAFGSDDVGTLLGAAAQFVEVMTHGTCNGFLSASARARIAQYEKARAALARER